MSMLTRVMKYNRLPFIINKMNIFLFLNKKKKKKRKSYRHTSKEGNKRHLTTFCTKKTNKQEKNRLFKAQGTEPFKLKLKTLKSWNRSRLAFILMKQVW